MISRQAKQINYVLRKMNFKVSDFSYFYVCNGEKTNDKFENKLDFKSTLIPFLPITINKDVIANKIKAAANASENQVQILFGL